jgi:hypothetical protein
LAARDLLGEAVRRAADAGLQAATKFIAVGPIDEDARSFYAHFGFRKVVGDVAGHMYLRIDEAWQRLTNSRSQVRHWRRRGFRIIVCGCLVLSRIDGGYGSS